MPKSNDIAQYVIDNGVTAHDLIAMLTKYDALAMLPNILKKMKYFNAIDNPQPVIDLAHSDIGANVIKDINEAYSLNNSLVNFDSKMIAGYRVVKDYKMYDMSVSGYIDRLFR